MIFIYINNFISKYTRLVVIPRFATALFIIFQLMGMFLYPGGTMYNFASEGYTFSENFFSDMGAYTARNGEPNYLSMILFSFSLSIVGVTFILYYFTLPLVFKSDKINFLLASIGTLFAFIGSICLIGTGLTPSDLVLESHQFFANNIFYSFLITSFFYTIAIFRSNEIEKKYAIGYFIFFSSILIYVGILNFGPSADVNNPALIFQVVSQKIIVLVFVLSVLHQTFCFSKFND